MKSLLSNIKTDLLFLLLVPPCIIFSAIALKSQDIVVQRVVFKDIQPGFLLSEEKFATLKNTSNKMLYLNDVGSEYTIPDTYKEQLKEMGFRIHSTLFSINNIHQFVLAPEDSITIPVFVTISALPAVPKDTVFHISSSFSYRLGCSDSKEIIDSFDIEISITKRPYPVFMSANIGDYFTCPDEELSPPSGTSLAVCNTTTRSFWVDSIKILQTSKGLRQVGLIQPQDIRIDTVPLNLPILVDANSHRLFGYVEQFGLGETSIASTLLYCHYSDNNETFQLQNKFEIRNRFRSPNFIHLPYYYKIAEELGQVVDSNKQSLFIQSCSQESSTLDSITVEGPWQENEVIVSLLDGFSMPLQLQSGLRYAASVMWKSKTIGDSFGSLICWFSNSKGEVTTRCKRLYTSLNIQTHVVEPDEENKRIVMFPNPSTNYVKIAPLSQSTRVNTIKIVNTTGKEEELTFAYSTDSILECNISTISNGAYTLYAYSNGNLLFTKLLIVSR